MNLRAEIQTLRYDLACLAAASDAGSLARRYALRYPLRGRLSLYRRTRRLVGKVLRSIGFLKEPWLPHLKHLDQGEDARAFVIWAFGTDRDTLRKACTGFQTLRGTAPGWVPVLVTDAADFAFFSRLGWLVEYVPMLSAPASGYAERKKRYLAWRYRDAPALPVSAGLREGVQIEELLRG